MLVIEQPEKKLFYSLCNNSNCVILHESVFISCLLSSAVSMAMSLEKKKFETHFILIFLSCLLFSKLNFSVETNSRANPVSCQQKKSALHNLSLANALAFRQLILALGTSRQPFSAPLCRTPVQLLHWWRIFSFCELGFMKVPPATGLRAENHLPF